jgi:hypothetical protein
MNQKELIRQIERILDDNATTTRSHCDQPASFIRAKVTEMFGDSKRQIVNLLKNELSDGET